MRSAFFNMLPFSNYRHIFSSEEDAIAFLFEKNVLKFMEKCTECNYSPLVRYGKIYRCNRKECRKSVSIFGFMIFSKTKIPVHQLLELSYFWLVGIKHTQLNIITGISRPTITSTLKLFRKLVADSLDFVDLQIGGNGVVVEIDEAKMGKVKYNRGHRVDGAWVLGGVERTPERRLFLVEVPDRTENTLLSIIRTYVLPGSVIMTDCFKSYHNLSQYYTHLTVNHSENFVDPISGACTNTIEGTWASLKYKISPRNRTNSLDEEGNIIEHLLDDFLCEFQWRRVHKNNLWESFITSLKEIEFN